MKQANLGTVQLMTCFAITFKMFAECGLTHLIHRYIFYICMYKLDHMYTFFNIVVNPSDGEVNEDVLKRLKDLKGAAKKKVMRPQPKLDVDR